MSVYEVIPPYQNGDRAYVLGARKDSGNIGEAVVKQLASLGYLVKGDDGAVGDGSRPPGGNMPTDEIAMEHGYNVTERGRYQRFEPPPSSRFESFDPNVLVITSGVTYKDHFAETSAWEVRRVITANLIFPLEAARRYVAAREARSPGEPSHIVFVGSYAHRHPFTNGTLYCASKAGLDMAAKTLGWELTDRGFRVHVVHPYHVQGTPMWTEVEEGVMRSKGMTLEEADAYNRKDLKMPDLLTPREVAEVIALLVTQPALEWLSGTAIELNGGAR